MVSPKNRVHTISYTLHKRKPGKRIMQPIVDRINAKEMYTKQQVNELFNFNTGYLNRLISARDNTPPRIKSEETEEGVLISGAELIIYAEKKMVVPEDAIPLPEFLKAVGLKSAASFSNEKKVCHEVNGSEQYWFRYCFKRPLNDQSFAITYFPLYKDPITGKMFVDREHLEAIKRDQDNENDVEVSVAEKELKKKKGAIKQNMVEKNGNRYYAYNLVEGKFLVPVYYPRPGEMYLDGEKFEELLHRIRSEKRMYKPATRIAKRLGINRKTLQEFLDRNKEGRVVVLNLDGVRRVIKPLKPSKRAGVFFRKRDVEIITEYYKLMRAYQNGEYIPVSQAFKRSKYTSEVSKRIENRISHEEDGIYVRISDSVFVKLRQTNMGYMVKKEDLEALKVMGYLFFSGKRTAGRKVRDLRSIEDEKLKEELVKEYELSKLMPKYVFPNNLDGLWKKINLESKEEKEDAFREIMFDLDLVGTPAMNEEKRRKLTLKLKILFEYIAKKGDKEFEKACVSAPRIEILNSLGIDPKEVDEIAVLLTRLTDYELPVPVAFINGKAYFSEKAGEAMDIEWIGNNVEIDEDDVGFISYAAITAITRLQQSKPIEIETNWGDMRTLWVLRNLYVKGVLSMSDMVQKAHELGIYENSVDVLFWED